MYLEADGWLLDVYPDGQGGLAVWFLDEDGERRCLHQPFPVTFYAAAPPQDLRSAWRWLERQPESLQLGRTERQDLFQAQPQTVLSVQVADPALQPGLFNRFSQAFPDLTYYDADLQITLRYAAWNATFPLVYCTVVFDAENRLHSLSARETPWTLAPSTPPLRILSIELDSDPQHSPPRALRLQCGRAHYTLDLQPARPLLVNLAAILRRHDPDLILTAWGDTWLLPHLLDLAQQHALPLPLNRDASRPPARREGRSYFSYGQVIYLGPQVLLFGRSHVDIYNAMLFHDYGLEGIFELGRVSSLPLQTVARASPGTGISSMQILTALRRGVLVPWHKQRPEDLKSARDLMHADQGGLVYQPTTGLHRDVAEIDFISMYPSIMVHFNISPETVDQNAPAARNVPELNLWIDQEHRGLIPETLAPLLEKRINLKEQLALAPAWDPRREAYKARASAHKWLLVTCFGYLGYKNARFGRIEAHEAVTAYGREALLRAKEAAEDLGFTVLHLYVDGMWVHKPGCRLVPDFQPLLNEILDRTGLPVALDGVYHWVAFLPSRVNPRVPVPNRYFGVFQDGSLKMRGIETRRRDTPPFLKKLQLEMLAALTGLNLDAPPGVPGMQGINLTSLLELLRRRLQDLRAGRIPLPDLLVTHKVSRTLEEFRSPSPAARALHQLQTIGKVLKPGQHVRFLYLRGEPGVHAWDLAQPPDPASVDVAYYSVLLVRTAATILQPFGVDEVTLQHWLFANAAYGARPGILPAPAARRYPLLAGVPADGSNAARLSRPRGKGVHNQGKGIGEWRLAGGLPTITSYDAGVQHEIRAARTNLTGK